LRGGIRTRNIANFEKALTLAFELLKSVSAAPRTLPMTLSYTRWPKIIDASLRSAADVFRTPELIIVILQSSLLLNVRER